MLSGGCDGGLWLRWKMLVSLFTAAKWCYI